MSKKKIEKAKKRANKLQAEKAKQHKSKQNTYPAYYKKYLQNIKKIGVDEFLSKSDKFIILSIYNKTALTLHITDTVNDDEIDMIKNIVSQEWLCVDISLDKNCKTKNVFLALASANIADANKCFIHSNTDANIYLVHKSVYSAFERFYNNSIIIN